MGTVMSITLVAHYNTEHKRGEDYTSTHFLLSQDTASKKFVGLGKVDCEINERIKTSKHWLHY